MKYTAKDMPSLRFDRETGEGTIDFPARVGRIDLIADEHHRPILLTENGCRWLIRSVETEHDTPLVMPAANNK